jgi:hypothetical protein
MSKPYTKFLKDLTPITAAMVATLVNGVSELIPFTLLKLIISTVACVPTVILVLHWGYKAGLCAILFQALLYLAFGEPQGIFVYLLSILAPSMALLWGRTHKWDDMTIVTGLYGIYGFIMSVYITSSKDIPIIIGTLVGDNADRLMQVIPYLGGVFCLSGCGLFLFGIWVAKQTMSHLNLAPIHYSVSTTNPKKWDMVWAASAMCAIVGTFFKIPLLENCGKTIAVVTLLPLFYLGYMVMMNVLKSYKIKNSNIWGLVIGAVSILLVVPALLITLIGIASPWIKTWINSWIQKKLNDK